MRRNLFQLSIVMLALLIVSACGGKPERGSPEWDKALEDREILVESTDVEGSDLQVVTAIGVMDVPPEVAWQVFADVSDFKTFLWRMEDSIEYPKQGDERVIEFVVNAPALAMGAGFNRIQIKASLVSTEYDSGVRIGEFTMLEGNVARAYGSWRIEPWKGEKRSKVSFSMFIDFGDIYLPDSIVDYMSQVYLKDFLIAWGENLREHVENPENRIVYEQQAAKAAGKDPSKIGPNLEGVDDFLQ